MKATFVSVGILGLVGLIFANTIIGDSPVRSSPKLSDEDSSLVKGSSFTITSVHLFKKCAIMPLCEENNCPNDKCVGLETKPEPEAKNVGCSELDWWSQCVQWDNWTFDPKKPCAKHVAVCAQVYDEESEGLVCVKRPFPTGSFSFAPTAPDNCVTNTIPNPFDPVP